MTTIDANTLNKINGKTSGSSAASSAADANSPEAIQNRFLKMLTTQLQSQDPLNPTDTAQMTSQMAQISTVSGITNLNKSIQQMIQSQTSSQAMAASNLIGRQVLVDGNGLSLRNGSAAAAVNLAGDADSAKIDIVDATGATVDTLTLNKPGSGTTNFSWDGTDLAGKKVPDGKYTFRIQASKAGVAVQTTPMTFQTVAGITLNQGTPQVVLGDGSRMDLSKVQQVS